MSLEEAAMGKSRSSKSTNAHGSKSKDRTTESSTKKKARSSTSKEDDEAPSSSVPRRNSFVDDLTEGIATLWRGAGYAAEHVTTAAKTVSYSVKESIVNMADSLRRVDSAGRPMPNSKLGTNTPTFSHE